MMNIIFAGTPEFAAVSLKALLASPHTIQAVYTQPDRPAGRGRKLTPSAVKELALQHNLPVLQPETLRTQENQNILAAHNADIMIVAAYGLMLPKAVLQIPPLGCINVHASLLPRWRGAAPIQRAILADDERTGVTIMQMNEGLDTGDMLYKLECLIEETETSQTLHDKLAQLGAQALLTTLEKLNELKPVKQDDNLATYAKKITKEEAKINWELPAYQIARQVRAYNPWPVAFFGDGEKAIRVFQVEIINNLAIEQPGKILQISSAGIEVGTARGILRLLKLQLPGGKILAAADILNAHSKQFAVGKQL